MVIIYSTPTKQGEPDRDNSLKWFSRLDGWDSIPGRDK